MVSAVRSKPGPERRGEDSDHCRDASGFQCSERLGDDRPAFDASCCPPDASVDEHGDSAVLFLVRDVVVVQVLDVDPIDLPQSGEARDDPLAFGGPAILDPPGDVSTVAGIGCVQGDLPWRATITPAPLEIRSNQLEVDLRDVVAQALVVLYRNGVDASFGVDVTSEGALDPPCPTVRPPRPELLQRQKIRRHANERYNWEKSRASLSEAERAEWIAEREVGISAADVDFTADYEQIEATPDIAADFKIVAGMPLLRRQYRTGSKTDDTSLFLNRSYIPVDLISDNPDLLDASNEPWPGGTLHQLRTVGIEVAQIVDEVTARPPTPDEARALDVESGTSVLVIRKTSIDTTGRVVEIAETILAGDRTELVYTTNLEPWT